MTDRLIPTVDPKYAAYLMKGAVQCGVPPSLRDGLVMYLTSRRPVGGFLTAVLKNDLREAVGRADEVNARAFPEIIRFLTSYASAVAWGSPEIVSAWLASEDEVPVFYDIS